ncbi:hypothetical protein FHX08_005191 [Rhizobium sp. BK529]|uniref:hypothetical protein n=1 Tax=Rhizobium sp. BK529 TaxID=2586983 RepID=UPI00160881EA|nr:hypothetical protein [Rhizobium sp. BK529]MBB3594781.1 hypothetical protein [Rhizobium sp. BK529]
MRQKKPFIVEIKRPRKPKTGLCKPAIWGDLDLRQDQDVAATAPTNGPASVSEGAPD